MEDTSFDGSDGPHTMSDTSLAEIECVDSIFSPEMFRDACMAGDLQGIPVSRWLNGVSINDSSSSGLDFNPIAIASLGDHVGVVKELLRNGCIVDPNVVIMVARKGYRELLETLLGACLSYETPAAVLALAASSVNMNVGTRGAIPEAMFVLQEKHNNLLYGPVQLMINICSENPALSLSTFLNTPDASGYTPILLAIVHNNTRLVRMLLDARADITICDPSDATPLYRAIFEGKDPIVSMLLDVSDDKINTRNSRGEVPLVFSAYHGRTEAVRLLLAHGADVTVLGAGGFTALMATCVRGHVETARVLLDAGAGSVVNARGGKGGLTALMLAFSGKTPGMEMTQLLLDFGADVNARSTDGSTALMLAPSVEVGRLLLSAGAVASINAQHNNGTTALFLTVGRGDTALVELLLSHGADPTLVKNDKSSPLAYACSRDNAAIVKLLLDAGVGETISSVNDKGFAPIVYALNNVVPRDIVLMLLAAGACVRVRDNYGRPLLLKACQHQEIDIDVVQALVEAGGTELVNAVDNSGHTALMWATRLVSVEAVKILIAAGADVNHANMNGSTALLQLCLYGFTAAHAALMRALLDAGADPLVVDNDSTTSLMESCSYYSDDMDDDSDDTDWDDSDSDEDDEVQIARERRAEKKERERVAMDEDNVSRLRMLIDHVRSLPSSA